MKPPSQKHHPAKAAVTQFLCPEALDWLLSQMSAAALCNAVKSYPSWCSQLCRGGFKLTPQNLSSPAMHERLRQLMLRNPTYAEELL
ncbi:MAG: hypothetical protein PHC30_06830, partial [Lentisphaeria bacterium]|nr:hypothetical protein [Lentisphaeria bacterium]